MPERRQNMTKPHRVLIGTNKNPSDTEGAYLDAMRKNAVLATLKQAIRETYTELGPDEACGTVQWMHNFVHVEFLK